MCKGERLGARVGRDVWAVDRGKNTTHNITFVNTASPHGHPCAMWGSGRLNVNQSLAIYVGEWMYVLGTEIKIAKIKKIQNPSFLSRRKSDGLKLSVQELWENSREIECFCSSAMARCWGTGTVLKVSDEKCLHQLFHTPFFPVIDRNRAVYGMQ